MSLWSRQKSRRETSFCCMSDSLPAEFLHGILATYWHERGNWLYGCRRTYFLLTVTLVVPKLLNVLSFAFQGLAYTFIFSAQNPKTQQSVFGDLKWDSTVHYTSRITLPYLFKNNLLWGLWRSSCPGHEYNYQRCWFPSLNIRADQVKTARRK